MCRNPSKMEISSAMLPAHHVSIMRYHASCVAKLLSNAVANDEESNTTVMMPTHMRQPMRQAAWSSSHEWSQMRPLRSKMVARILKTAPDLNWSSNVHETMWQMMATHKRLQCNAKAERNSSVLKAIMLCSDMLSLGPRSER